jgi:hypothetical protein
LVAQSQSVRRGGKDLIIHSNLLLSVDRKLEVMSCPACLC